MKPLCALLLASLLPLTGCATADPVSSPEPYDAYRIHPFLGFDTEDSLTADVALADLDNDGDLDVLAANGRHWAQQDFAFLNDGTGRLLEATRIGERLSASYVLCPADLDRDGDTDLVVIRDMLPAQIFLNDGAASFRLSGTVPDSAGTSRAGLTADFNGDTLPDLVIANRRGPDMIYFGNGKGGFSAGQSLPGADKGSTGVAAADLDRDGDMDLVISRRDDEPSMVFSNTGNGSFTATALPGSTGKHRKAAIGDFNGDSWPDIVLANFESQHKLYLGTAAKTFALKAQFGPADSGAQAIAAADLDGDGDIDLVEGTETINAVYLNDGKAGFTRHSIGEEADTYGVAIGDMNGDGKPDLVFANSGSPNTVLTAR